jgi:hypothetical protein
MEGVIPPDLSKIEKPALEIQLGDKTIKMTYGLELDLMRLLPDPAQALNLIMRDPFTQDYLVRRCLTNKTMMIVKDEELVQEVDLTSEEVEKLLTWVTDHALYFFVKRATALGTLAARYETVLPLPSTIGSTDSASTTPSAGPSSVSKETSTGSTGPTPEENSSKG